MPPLAQDGASHPVDSNELAFRIAAIQAFRQAYAEAEPVILEPIMKVEVTVPGDFQGGFSVLGSNVYMGQRLRTHRGGCGCSRCVGVPLPCCDRGSAAAAAEEAWDARMCISRDGGAEGPGPQRGDNKVEKNTPTFTLATLPNHGPPRFSPDAYLLPDPFSRPSPASLPVQRGGE